MARRLFVGVEIDPRVAAAAGALVDELRHRAQRLAPRARITWIPPDRLHLTVRFIGNVNDVAEHAIRSVLEAAVAVSPFDLSLAGIGAFPGSGRPQVLWAGLGDGRDRLQQVERDVTPRLTRAGIPPEGRPYSPHLTLARVREAAGLMAPPLFDGLERTALGTTRVEAITLFESRLSPKGPTYVPLQRTFLHG